MTSPCPSWSPPWPRRGPAGGRRRVRGQGPRPAGRRDLRPDRLDPDGRSARVAQRRRRRLGRPLRDLAGPLARPMGAHPAAAARRCRAARRAAWLLGLVVAVSLFLNSSRTVVLVGHDTVVRPTLARDAVVETGPLLPDLRFRDVGPLGVTSDARQDRGRVDRGAGRALRADRQRPDRARSRRSQDVVLDMALVGRPPRRWRSGCCRSRSSCSWAGTAAASSFRGLGDAAGPARAGAAAGARRCSCGSRGRATRTTQEDQGSWQTLADLAGPDVALPAGGRATSRCARDRSPPRASGWC